MRALLLVMLLGPALEPATLVVGPDGRFLTPGEAIRKAAAGDTIRIESGVYQGKLLLDKALTLEGAGKPVIRGNGEGSVITVTADGCTIRGLIVEQSGSLLVAEDSGILLRSSGHRIEDNELRDVLYGIYLYQSSGNSVARNVIRGRAWLELGERGSGIHIWNSRDNIIVDNAISEMRDGMYLQNASRSIIRDNRVFDLRYGLHYMFSEDNQFEDNLFYDNVAGAAIMYSRRIEFRRNAFLHNRGFSSFGILFQDSTDCLAEQNLVVDNGVGIFMEALRTSTFRRNLVAANDLALLVFASSSGNIFQSNNFIENLSPMQVIGKDTNTYWSREGTGNYWSEYRGHDLDGDGRGDVPFKIQNVFEHLEGNHPRLRLYLYSPASQALALAEKAFPLIEGSREFDDAPLMKPVALEVGLPQPVRSDHRRYTVAAPLLMLAVSVGVIAKGRKR